MSDPNSNILDETPELKKAIEGTTNNLELLEVLRQARFDQGKAAPHSWDPTGRDYYGIKPVVPAATERVSKTIVVNNVKYLIEGANDAEAQSNELALMRKLFSGAAAPATSEPARDSSGRFVSQADADAAAAAQAALDDAENPTRRIAAELLTDQGVDIEALKAFTEQKRGEAFARDWQTAGEQFRQGEIGSSWPGGKFAQDLIGSIIASNGLTDVEDKVGALEEAYKFIQENNLLADSPEAKEARAKDEYTRRIQEAKTPEELRIAAGYQDPAMRSNSSLWGR
jgi:hypothetical protein